MTHPHSDWEDDGIGEADIVVRRQDEIAVYNNERGEVVIRQHAWPDDDDLVLIAPENARRVAEAILRCIARMTGEPPARIVDGGPDESPDDLPARSRRDDEPARDRTAADRMRRYRERQRNEGRNGDRNADRNGTVVELPFLPPSDEEEMHALAR